MTQPIRVCICWTDISGYMAACWRAMSQDPRFNLLVIAFTPEDSSEAVFDRSVLAGIECRLVPRQRALVSDAEITRLVVDHRPQVLSVPGWRYDAYSTLLHQPASSGTPAIMSMDNPWNGSIRQRIGRYARRSFFQRISRVIVAGDRTFQFARYLGFDESQIFRGIYGIDFNRFSPLLEARRGLDSWPREFIYIGQYAVKKNLPLLLDAYDAYRRRVDDPWGLTCMGMGPLATTLKNREGITDRGFVQPADQAPILLNAGCFVLPSQYEPWGVAVAEAAASGLPVICSEACGSALEIVRGYYSGITVATGNQASLVSAMLHVHHHIEQMPEWGRRGQEFAAAFSAEAWLERWSAMIRGVLPPHAEV
jgi:glycosyltransferase involved in cell wall biosynthesis